MLASTLRRPRCAMPMATSWMPGARRVRQDVVEQRDQGLAALEGEALLAHELRLEELLEGLGADEGAQDVTLCVGGGGFVRALDALLNPRALLGSWCACTRCRPCACRCRAAA